jgi:hypothetical protein
MKRCCPPGDGCNARVAGEPCALALLRRLPSDDARRALELWTGYDAATGSKRARRFLRRAYERARDGALTPSAPWPGERDRVA